MAKSQVTIGTIWEDRASGKRCRVEGVNDGRVQLAPVNGGEYQIMKEKSLRNNYHLVAMATENAPAVEPLETADLSAETIQGISETIAKKRAETATASTTPSGDRQEAKTTETQATKPGPAITPAPAEEKKGRAPVGRVKLSDGKIIPGSQFIIQVCGKARDDSYKVDSPIRWLLKPAGQELLKEKDATIVYGEQVSK